MTTNELRQRYLEFFQERGHAILPSASLLPENDPTTLFTSSGMQPLIPYLLGEKHPKGARLVNSQKCFRTQDIEEVGDNRHTTFFEMLGNWSLGGYFKREEIPWLFEFLTKELALDGSRLYVTCFRGNDKLGIGRDAEAAELWRKEFERMKIDNKIVDFPERDGMQAGRIFYYDEKKNWWSRSGTSDKMPVGEPGGPDTEVFWDFFHQGESAEASREGGRVTFDFHANSQWRDKPCHVNCDCGRFFEIGNSVFIQYRKTDNGFEALPQKNVDFGGGLERLMAAVNDNPDIFLIDIFAPLRATVERVSNKRYGESGFVSKAFRVILDHLRAATFLIADGAEPTNKDQGYFTRRLMRRSIRYARELGIAQNFCAEVASAVVAAYGEVYPNLEKQKSVIVSQMTEEEEKFRQTVQKGMKRFEEEIKEMGKEKMGKGEELAISGVNAFDLYQTYGFPLELTQELARERGLTVDASGFAKEKDKHQSVSRQGAEKKFHGGLMDHSEKTVRGHTATHLLHAALRKVLGDHVQQKGSNITPERVRFDFSHPAKLTSEEVKQVEDLVNAAVKRDYPVTWREVKKAEAYKKKTIGFFPERYDEMVKVYTIGDPDQPMTADPAQPTFSQEICGGPHVEHTAQVGEFKIVKEEALGAGMRRIKAVLE